MPGFNKILVSRENGSITVMIAFLLPVMLLMLMLIVNINQLFFQKIRLQNTVDACALSAAAVQAAGLNEIADLNQDMVDEHRNIRNILGRSPPWYNYSSANSAKQWFNNGSAGVLDWIDKYQISANTYYAFMADAIAQNVKNMNLPQSSLIPRHRQGSLASFTMERMPCTFRYYTKTDTSMFPSYSPTRIWVKPLSLPMFKGYHDGSFTIIAKRIIPLTGVFTLPYQRHKTSRVEVSYEIILPPQNFLLANSLFNGVPMLRARAKAKPAGGSITKLRPAYTAVLVD